MDTLYIALYKGKFKEIFLILFYRHNCKLGYQIRSRHAFLKMLTGLTKIEEDQSFDNINILLITSTSVMFLSCVMEVLMYFLYNNKV